jgi:hypothetical protein
MDDLDQETRQLCERASSRLSGGHPEKNHACPA